MTRLVTGLAVLALLALCAGCGQTATTGPSGPAVAVAWTPESGQLGGAYSASLTPTDSPSGVIALKVVHDGNVRTLATYRFRSLQRPGSVQVKTARHTIAVSWILPGSGTGQRRGRVSISRRLHTDGAAWSSGSVNPRSGLEEETIWEQEYARSWPEAGYSGMTIGSFEALVSDSIQYWHRTAYCLTLKVEAR